MGLKPPWWIHMGEPSNDTVGFSQLNLQSYPFPTMKHTPIGDARMNRSSSTQGLFGCEIWFLFSCICIIYICIDTNFFQQNICVFYYFWDSRKQTPKKDVTSSDLSRVAAMGDPKDMLLFATDWDLSWLQLINNLQHGGWAMGVEQFQYLQELWH